MGGKVRSQWLRLDGLDVHYVTAGEGQPVLLLHGGASDWREWRYNLNALSEFYCVYAPDIIGYGLSDKSKGAYTLEDFLCFTHELVAALGLKRIHMIGQSLGARVCLDYAFHYPEQVDKLVVIAPFGLGKLSLLGKSVGTAAWTLRKFTFRKQPYPSLQLDDVGKDGRVLLNRLEHIQAATLIIWGRRDRYFPVAQAHKAHKLLRNSRLEIFAHCGHAPQREESESFNKLAIGFLSHSVFSEVS